MIIHYQIVNYTDSELLNPIYFVLPASRRQTHQQPLTVACLNVRTLLDRADLPERRTAIVARELARYDIDIDTLSETRREDEDALNESGAGYTFFWKGMPSGEVRQADVGFAIKNKLLSKLDELPKVVNERLMTLRIPLQCGRALTLVSAYAPTMRYDDDTIERFYSHLNEIILSTPTADKLTILGDFNARLGKDTVTWKNIIGSHGIGKTATVLSSCPYALNTTSSSQTQLSANQHITSLHGNIRAPSTGTSLTTLSPSGVTGATSV